MALNQTDYNKKMMQNDFGTVCLITNPKADKYLNRPKENRLSKWCGGKNGFDDFVERYEE